jgi:hypothetical protein
MMQRSTCKEAKGFPYRRSVGSEALGEVPRSNQIALSIGTAATVAYQFLGSLASFDRYILAHTRYSILIDI